MIRSVAFRRLGQYPCNPPCGPDILTGLPTVCVEVPPPAGSYLPSASYCTPAATAQPATTGGPGQMAVTAAPIVQPPTSGSPPQMAVTAAPVSAILTPATVLPISASAPAPAFDVGDVSTWPWYMWGGIGLLAFMVLKK
jgi:hypothetical protein